ncbi:MAG: hypothetical protein P1V97_19085 [Planctomycetota bacterium]|nr:hypothetical protein [Planctomycetota bacterium]
MESAFNIVCAWCQHLMREAGLENAPTSHAICDACFDKKIEDHRREQRQRKRSNVKHRVKSVAQTRAC